MIVYKPDGSIIDVTDKAFRVLYKSRGFVAKDSYENSKTEYESYSKAELLELVDKRGLEVKKSATKAELIALLEV